MPRKGPAIRREITPDPIYNDTDVTRFINRMMVDGKKSVAERIFYTALEQIETKAGRPGIDVFHDAMRRVMPVVEVKRRRKALGIRWLVTYSRRRNGRSMVDKLTNELLDAANGTGGAVRKREEGFKMAEANKAFSHYRF
jgi:small subunit ribosomal protein S7